MKRFAINEDLKMVLTQYLRTQPLGEVEVIHSELTRLEEIKEPEPKKESSVE